MCVFKNVASGAVQKRGCVWLPPDNFSPSLMGANATVVQCSCHLKAHHAKSASPIASRDTLLWPSR